MTTKKNHNISDIHDHDVLIDTREIFLGSHSSGDHDDQGIDGKTAISFIKNIRILESISKKPIIIHQYNIGGDINAGMAIFDAIQNSACEFVFVCYGVAASMGSIIPQSVLNKGIRLTTMNCEWLLHYGSTSIQGTHQQVVSAVQYGDNYRKKFLDIYADSCFGSKYFGDTTKNSIKKYIEGQLRKKEDWIFSGVEALEYGLVDGILGTESYKDVLRIL